MRVIHSVAKSHITKTQSPQLQAGWQELQQLVLETHELGDGLVLDFPAHEYELIVNLVEHERENCGDWIHLTIERREGLLYLTVTSDHSNAQEEVRSLIGLAA